MSDEKFALYDKVVYSTIVNIYTISKDNQEIKLKNFNFKNPAHLALLNIIRTASYQFQWDIKYKVPLYKKIYYTIKKYNKYYLLDFCRKFSNNEGIIEANDIINFVEEGFNSRGLFEEIYNEYYSY